MEGQFRIGLVQQRDYRFEVHFDNPAVPFLVTDERAPLGADAGPNPSRLLGAAVANCLAASLLFAMRKFGNEPGPLTAEATVTIARNAQKRMRIARVGVDLHLGVPASAIVMRERILAQFEEFCIVTQSLRAAIPVDVRVLDATGAVLHGPAAPAKVA
jgi:organic hydroperoxide reductase OsmC/OhrA